MKVLARLLSVATVLFLLVGCDIATPPPTEPPAAEMLPVLADYNTVEGELLTEYLSGLSEGAALLAGQPQIAAIILVVDGVIGCYQEVGAARARVYSHKGNPLLAGAVAIADRNALTNPMNLLQCIGPAVMDSAEPGPEGVRLEPCTASYTLAKDDNEFYILYAGTMPQMCETFCAALEGCTVHPPGSLTGGEAAEE